MSLEEFLNLRRQQLKLKLENTDYRLLPYYSNARDRIIQPHKNLVVTDYLLTKWQKRLGASAFGLVLTLRMLAKEVVGESEETGIVVKAEELSFLTGLSTRQIQRLLSDANLKESDLGRFVAKQRTWGRNLIGGQIQQGPNLYYVQMDDPIAPEDEPRLIDELVDQELRSQLSRLDPDPPAPDRQNVGQRDRQDVVHYDRQDGGAESDRMAPRPPNRRGQVGGHPAESAGQNVYGSEPKEESYIGNVPAGRSIIRGEEGILGRIEASRSEVQTAANAVATRICDALKDWGSLQWWYWVALQFGAAGQALVLEELLKQVRQKQQQGDIKGTPGAYFTGMVKRVAEALAISLERPKEDPREIRRIIESSLPPEPEDEQ